MRVVFIQSLFLLAVFGVSAVAAQTSEVTITLNEQFFDGLLDAAFQNAPPPQFSLAKSLDRGNGTPAITPTAYAPASDCDESITILRENKNVRTGVRFRDGKIVAPLAFTGRYNPPLLGCVQFSGSADAVVALNFDVERKVLTGQASITNVSLDGTGGLGGSLIARMVQGSIDKKINPIQILDIDRLTFTVPIQNSSKLAMKATGLRSEVVGNALNVYVQFAFVKA
jgi:hypothetical protein